MTSLLEDFLTEEQLADELGRTRVTLRRWRNRRDGPPFVRIGKEVLYKRTAVRAWLDSLEVKTKAAA